MLFAFRFCFIALLQSARLGYHRKKTLSIAFFLIFVFSKNTWKPLFSSSPLLLYLQLYLFSKHLIHFYKYPNYLIFKYFLDHLLPSFHFLLKTLSFFSFLNEFCWTFVVYLVYFTLYNAIVKLKKLIREPLITPIIFTASYWYPLSIRGCKKLR